MKNLIEYIPPFLKEVREYNRIFNAEDIELRNLDMELKSLVTEVIVKTAKSYGLDRYEKIYNINNTSNSINARRAMILTKINSRVPFTYKWLYNQLLENFGENGFKINLDYSNYYLEIVLYSISSEVTDILIQNLYEKLPANIQQTFRLIAESDYNVGAAVVQKESDTLIIDNSVIKEQENIDNADNIGIIITQIEENRLKVDNSIIKETTSISQNHNVGMTIIQKGIEKINIDNSIINEKISINNTDYIASSVIQKENINLKEE